MELYEAIRIRQCDLINQNPTTITISRTARTQADDGGWTSTTTNLAAQTVRIYTKSQLRIVTDTSEAGFRHVKVFKMIAQYNANVLKETADNIDRFTVGARTFKIVDVRPVTNQGYTVFIEAYIEEIN
jgi:hypothetical protein